jgi:hypothetical protein
LIQSNFSGLKSLKARYIKFKIRNNSVTCLENSPLVNKYTKPKALGINFISVMGYDVLQVGNINTSLHEMARESSSKVLSLVFRKDFSSTLKAVSQDTHFVQFVKDNLSRMLMLMDSGSLSNVIGQLLKAFVGYNKEVGEWIITRLLEEGRSQGQVGMLGTLVKANPMFFLSRIGIIKEFIFERIAEEIKKDVNLEEIRRIEPYMNIWMELVGFFSKNLRVEKWRKKVFGIKIDIQEENHMINFVNEKRGEIMMLGFEDFNNLLNLLEKIDQAEFISKQNSKLEIISTI